MVRFTWTMCVRFTAGGQGLPAAQENVGFNPLAKYPLAPNDGNRAPVP